MRRNRTTKEEVAAVVEIPTCITQGSKYRFLVLSANRCSLSVENLGGR